MPCAAPAGFCKVPCKYLWLRCLPVARINYFMQMMQRFTFARMAKFAHDTVMPDRESGLGKKEQVAEMFDDIAGKYDFMNRFLSGGRDVRWRKKAIGELRSLQPRRVLDVATGTGDVALLLYRMLQPEHITGIDISEGMLAVGRQKIAKAGLQQQIDLVQADSAGIPFEDATFDAITVAFGVRNFEHLEKGLAEMRRVLKPGGKLVVLEFSRPRNPVFKGLYLFYMNVVSPALGKLFASNRKAYAYLNKSMQAFPEREGFTAIMQSAGFRQTYHKALNMGICCIYGGSK
jgi:demethylmenaquinone methyltransferase/2-methoxy-6-polyprenyl-1,4-benzoquinol methylase